MLCVCFCLCFFSLLDTCIKLNSPDKEPTVEREGSNFQGIPNTPWMLITILKRLSNSKYCCGYRKQDVKEHWEHIRKTHHA